MNKEEHIELVEKKISEFNALEIALNDILGDSSRPMFGKKGRFTRWKEFYRLMHAFRHTLRVRRDELKELLNGLLQ
jgi:hypothetical protein